MDGQEEEQYIALEEVLGDEEDYFYADAKILNQSENTGEGDYTYVNIQYSRRKDYDGTYEHGLSYNTDTYTASGSSNYKSCSLDKFTPWFVKPDDYKDEDQEGLMSRKDPDDDKYFKPETDDYILATNAYGSSTAGYEYYSSGA